MAFAGGVGYILLGQYASPDVVVTLRRTCFILTFIVCLVIIQIMQEISDFVINNFKYRYRHQNKCEK